MVGVSSCSSGQRQSGFIMPPAPGGYDNDASLAIDVGGDILTSMFGPTLGGLINNTLADIVADEATSGFSSNDPDSAYFSAINNQLSSIQNTLTGTDNQISGVLSSMNQYQLANETTQVSTMIYNINNMYEQMQDILYAQNYDDGQIFSGEEAGTISSSTMQYLYNNQETLIQKLGLSSTLDLYIQMLANDSSSPYNATVPSVHQPMANPSNGLVQQMLLAGYNTLTSSYSGVVSTALPVSATNPANSNLLVKYLEWNQSVDLMSLQIILALSQAYVIQQIQLALAFQPNSPFPVPASIDPVDVKNYSAAAADLKYAYQQRIINLTNNFFVPAKQRYAAAIDLPLIYSQSLDDNCGVNDTSITSDTVDNLENSGMTWNMKTFSATCNYKNSRGQQLSQVFSQNLGLLCATNNSSPASWNVHVYNGNIYCGVLNWSPNLLVNPQIGTRVADINNTLSDDYVEHEITYPSGWNGVMYPLSDIYLFSSFNILGGGTDPFVIFNTPNTIGFSNGSSTMNSNGAGVLVFDGSHYYVVYYVNTSPAIGYSGFFGVACLIDDLSCPASNEPTQPISFTNGDTISPVYFNTGNVPWYDLPTGTDGYMINTNYVQYNSQWMNNINAY